ncbi:cyclin [Vairimorpha ceranae]|uniref:Cyclin n=1 Tax=Vairimorpha ceranae TaxID=40302 RepID=A0A0F9WPS5_9MICR|nr:cyclin [Vairimorpha ceranae]KKO74948.1 cyclin [Vairimorpha ceranae]
MYYKTKPQDENEYQKIQIDNKIFYTLKSKENSPVKKKKRYSDLLKDPLYIQQDLYRKLNMIKHFRNKNGDLFSLIDKWKSLIDECIILMKRDYEVSVQELFNLFRLEDYGFNIENYE